MKNFTYEDFLFTFFINISESAKQWRQIFAVNACLKIVTKYHLVPN